MDKLTTRQRQVLNFIRRSIQKNGIAPTRAEIADAMGFQSKNAAVDHLKALERKGFIRLHSDLSRGIQLLEGDDGDAGEIDIAVQTIPVIGSVAAGSPIEAIENVEHGGEPSRMSTPKSSSGNWQSAIFTKSCTPIWYDRRGEKFCR